jgi:hypothetical protein
MGHRVKRDERDGGRELEVGGAAIRQAQALRLEEKDQRTLEAHS